MGEVADNQLCQVEVNGEPIADITSSNDRKTMKIEAAARALFILRQHNWTILIKQAADTDETGVSKTEIVGNADSKKIHKAIPDSNIGNKLLKMMGWKGGGIGAEGRKGIAEPVSVSGMVNRSGLGLEASQGISRGFLPKIRTIISEFIRSDREDDLAFAPDFTKEERALIHKEAQKCHLKSHSHGKNEERFIVLSRKRNASETIDFVMRQGGETSKYKLIAPGEHPGLEEGGEGKQWDFMSVDSEWDEQS